MHGQSWIQRSGFSIKEKSLNLRFEFEKGETWKEAFREKWNLLYWYDLRLVVQRFFQKLILKVKKISMESKGVLGSGNPLNFSRKFFFIICDKIEPYLGKKKHVDNFHS